MYLEERDYQLRIHKKSIEYLQKPNKGIVKSLLIESPTGSGKTCCAMKIAKYLEGLGHKIGWIAHRKGLLKQANKCNQNFFGITDIKFISLFTTKPEQYQDRTVIVVDECQHDASKSASVLHDVIRPDMIIGLTATPYRTDKAQLCFQKVIRDAGIHQLIREGYLAEFAQHVYNQEWTPENIADLFCSYPERWGKSVIYFLTTADAIKCSDIIKSRGFACDYIIGSEPREERLQAFENDELQVLTNVAVLTEGWDCPSLKTAFVRPSSKGPTVQMAGRAFRKFEGLPVVNIIQNMDTKYPFTRHARAFNQWMMEDGEWRSIDPKNLAPVFLEQRLKVAKAVIDMPDYLKQRNKGLFGGFTENQMEV